MDSHISGVTAGVDLKSKIGPPSQYTNLTMLKPQNSRRKDSDL